MDWFYALNDQQCGPVNDAQFAELIRSGKLNRDTLVWNAGMSDWQPLHTVRSLPTSAAPPPVPSAMLPGTSAPCVECGRVHAQSDMLFLNRSWVCAACKPIYLQRLAEGAATPLTVDGLWRYQKQLVTRSETPMPDRCVKCNKPANGFRLKRQLYWHHPAIYILILVSIIIYAIVAMVVRKKAVLHIGLCEEHRAQRQRTILGCWLVALSGLGGLILGISIASWILCLSGVVMLLGSAIVGAIRAPIIRAAKIEDSVVRVTGPGSEFLSQLPEWMGRI